MNNENYTVDYFISKFEAIPEDRWCVRDIGTPETPRCALGHAFGEVRYDKRAQELCELFNTLDTAPGDFYTLPGINNGDDPRYQQPTPRDIKAKQEAEQLTNLQQCGSGREIPVFDGCASGIRPQPLLQPSPPPVREPVGCVHMWLETTQTCLYCCASKPVERKELTI